MQIELEIREKNSILHQNKNKNTFVELTTNIYHPFNQQSISSHHSAHNILEYPQK